MTDGDETIGAVLRTRDRVKPLFVSPGHLCDLEGAIAAVLAATRDVPAARRRRGFAHDHVNEMRRRGGVCRSAACPGSVRPGRSPAEPAPTMEPVRPIGRAARVSDSAGAGSAVRRGSCGAAQVSDPAGAGTVRSPPVRSASHPIARESFGRADGWVGDPAERTVGPAGPLAGLARSYSRSRLGSLLEAALPPIRSTTPWGRSCPTTASLERAARGEPG